MKTFRNFLILAIAILGFSFVDANAQRAERNQPLTGIEQKVFKKIIGLPNYGVFDHVTFEVNGGTVVLHGNVLSLGTRKSAENAVRKIEGVTEVVNNIQNLPPSGFDNRIRYELLRTYANTPALPGYLMEPNPSVRIIVSGGRVTLEGYVNNSGTKNLMGILANGIPGVFSVTNNLITERNSR